MKVTWKWLNEFVDLKGLDIESLEGRLASQGLHIEEIFRPGEEIRDVYIGYITKIEPHPDADRLKVCSVNMGERGVLQIVTAALNVQADVYVPVAVHGAVLSGGLKIKRTKLRGVVSEGMFCSLQELGLAEHSDGICLMTDLPEPVAGDPAHPYFSLDDTVIDFEITSNRADCLSVYGIAREVAMAAGRSLIKPLIEVRESDIPVERCIDVELREKEKCLRYTARVIQGVTVKPSPLKIRARLGLVGLRGINNIVDATNYVMWEYGLPLHGFDRNEIRGEKIIVRTAGSEESFVTLAGQQLKLSPDDLVIADTKQGIALAGVIGGGNSEISEQTKDVVLEAALFDPVSIRMTAKKHNQKTDSSYRFERGMDFDLASVSSLRAAELIAQWSGGSVCKGVAERRNEAFQPHRIVPLRLSQVSRHLGVSLNEEEVRDIFARLEYHVEKKTEGTLLLTVPSNRYWDISREIDLIEEVARFYGYDKIPESLPQMTMKKGRSDKKSLFKEKAEKHLLSNGFYEVYLYPLISEELVKKSGYEPGQVPRVTNPLNREMEYMTPEPLLGLLKAAELNMKRGMKEIRLYEWGKGYPSPDCEEEILSFLCTGDAPKTVFSQGYELGFYDTKAVFEGLLGELLPGNIEKRASRRSLWAPETGFVYLINNEKIFETGRLRDELTGFFDLRHDVWGGYGHVGILASQVRAGRSFVPFSIYPPVYYDLAFVTDSALPAGALAEEIISEGGSLLENCRLFDLYEGKTLPRGKKSLAFALTFRSQERTLTEKEIDAIIQRIINRAKKKFQAELR
ncbi:MAG TPA: phenylalanine--tRNA ligase subunit beta [Firmicutes bacterium]|nr:phenylalanine--tRNA ligase subunit beta [Bacillota bacterium]